MATIDAVYVPLGWRGFQDDEHHYLEILNTFGADMGIDMNDPDRRIYCRKEPMGQGRVFASASPFDSPFFDKQHPKFRGQKRYTWQAGPDGSQVGTLTDDARADLQARQTATAGTTPAQPADVTRGPAPLVRPEIARSAADPTAKGPSVPTHAGSPGSQESDV